MDRDDALKVAEAAEELEITRLCHLTPFSNLVHLACGDGLKSLTQLAETDDFDRQDLERLDGHPDHISCSIQYPNGWYLRQRKFQSTAIQRLFPDWVCLAIEPELLWADGTRVCVRNASALGGALIEDISPTSFEALYAPAIIGAYGKKRERSQTRLRAVPTDDQAEVLIHRQIPFTAVQQILVASESDAKRMHAGLKQIGATLPPSWAVAPLLFSAQPLSNAIAAGQAPPELIWELDDE
jgi:ssDNA thymidine ADP-ribosyltransferase, DarT